MSAKKRVSDYMTADPVVLRESGLLREAVELVLVRRIRHIPILNDTGGLVGIVTDRDIKRVLPSPLSASASDEYEAVLDTTPLTRVMTREPTTVSAEASIADAVRLLLGNKVGGLPVVRDGVLVGILTGRDALRGYLELLQRTGEA